MTLRARSGTTWDRASFTFPDMMSVSRRARRSPIPTQLNGRTTVYGSWYCSQAPLAKYSDASFWNPYVEIGGGELSCAPSGVGNTVADSYTIDDDITMIRCRCPSRWAAIAASKVD